MKGIGQGTSKKMCRPAIVDRRHTYIYVSVIRTRAYIFDMLEEDNGKANDQ